MKLHISLILAFSLTAFSAEPPNPLESQSESTCRASASKADPDEQFQRLLERVSQKNIRDLIKDKKAVELLKEKGILFHKVSRRDSDEFGIETPNRKRENYYMEATGLFASGIIHRILAPENNPQEHKKLKKIFDVLGIYKIRLQLFRLPGYKKKGEAVWLELAPSPAGNLDFYQIATKSWQKEWFTPEQVFHHIATAFGYDLTAPFPDSRVKFDDLFDGMKNPLDEQFEKEGLLALTALDAVVSDQFQNLELAKAMRIDLLRGLGYSFEEDRAHENITKDGTFSPPSECIEITNRIIQALKRITQDRYVVAHSGYFSKANLHGIQSLSKLKKELKVPATANLLQIENGQVRASDQGYIEVEGCRIRWEFAEALKYLEKK
ncbi:MAG: hypothetical protein AB7F43_05025 [Bacteriovoracia bacterium]